MTKKEELLKTREYLLTINNYSTQRNKNDQRIKEYYKYIIESNTREVFNYMLDKLFLQANNINIKKASYILNINNDLKDYNGKQAINIFSEFDYFKYIYQSFIEGENKLINLNELKSLANDEELDIKFYTRYSSLEENLDSNAIFGYVSLETSLPTKLVDDVKIYTIKRK